MIKTIRFNVLMTIAHPIAGRVTRPSGNHYVGPYHAQPTRNNNIMDWGHDE